MHVDSVVGASLVSRTPLDDPGVDLCQGSRVSQVATCGAESQGFDATHGLEGATRRKRKEKRACRRDLSRLVSSVPPPHSLLLFKVLPSRAKAVRVSSSKESRGLVPATCGASL